MGHGHRRVPEVRENGARLNWKREGVAREMGARRSGAAEVSGREEWSMRPRAWIAAHGSPPAEARTWSPPVGAAEAC
eukprot:6632074-Prymnesium_polylepis.1